jgi:hypothetical protein
MEEESHPVETPLTGTATISANTQDVSRSASNTSSENSPAPSIVLTENGSTSSCRPLAEGTSFEPAQDSIKVFLSVPDDGFKQRDNIAVYDDNGNLHPTDVYLKEQNHLLLLFNSNDVPVAACRHEKAQVYNTYNIYTTRPLYPADKDNFQHEGVSFYPQYRVREVNLCGRSLAYRSIMLWNGSHFEQLWRAYPPTQNQQDFAVDFFASKWHRDQTKEILVKCCVTDAPVALVSRDNERERWDMAIAPNVDPSLMVFVAAILEDDAGVRNIRSGR